MQCLGDDFESTDFADGTLSNAVRSQEIIIETKSNEEIEENRDFTIFVQQSLASVHSNSPLVKLLQSGSNVTVTIEDDDIGNSTSITNLIITAFNFHWYIYISS